MCAPLPPRASGPVSLVAGADSNRAQMAAQGEALLKYKFKRADKPHKRVLKCLCQRVGVRPARTRLHSRAPLPASRAVHLWIHALAQGVVTWSGDLQERQLQVLARRRRWTLTHRPGAEGARHSRR